MCVYVCVCVCVCDSVVVYRANEILYLIPNFKSLLMTDTK